MQEPLDTNTELLEELSAKYSPYEVSEICLLLRPFSLDGQIFAVRFFAKAATLRKRLAFSELIAIFSGQLDVWKTNPDRIADTGDCQHGMNNTRAFFQIYKAIGLSPKGLY